jgi:hypothetical protein
MPSSIAWFVRQRQAGNSNWTIKNVIVQKQKDCPRKNILHHH